MFGSSLIVLDSKVEKAVSRQPCSFNSVKVFLGKKTDFVCHSSLELFCLLPEQVECSPVGHKDEYLIVADNLVWLV